MVIYWCLHLSFYWKIDNDKSGRARGHSHQQVHFIYSNNERIGVASDDNKSSITTFMKICKGCYLNHKRFCWKVQTTKWFLWLIVFLIITRFPMSIEDSRKNVKIIIEEPRWKNLHHKLHKNIFDVIVSKLTLSFVTCFEYLHL